MEKRKPHPPLEKIIDSTQKVDDGSGDDDDESYLNRLAKKSKSGEIKKIKKKMITTLQQKFQNLFAIKEIFHSIVMSGFVSLQDVLGFSRVCKEWFEMIENSPEGFNVLMKNVIQSICNKMTFLKTRGKKYTENVFWTKEHVKMSYEMIRGWSNLRFCMSEPRFRFPTDSPYTFIGDGHVVTAQRFFTPHLIEGSIEKRKELPKKYMDDSYRIGNLMEVGNESNQFKFERIYWAQKLVVYSYEEFHFIAMICLISKRMEELEINYFQTIGQWEVDCSQVIRNVIKNGEVEILNQQYSYVFGSCFDGHLTHEIVKKIKRYSALKLTHLPYGFQHGSFDGVNDDFDEVEKSKTKATLKMNEFLNNTLRQMLYKYWKMRMLDVPLFKEFIFTVLIYLGARVEHAHRLSFYHDSLLEGSSLAEGADRGVMEWLDDYKLKASINFDEVYHSIVRKEQCYRGTIEGEKVCTYLYVLALKRDDANQICDYEFVSYQYYNYEMFGEILS